MQPIPSREPEGETPETTNKPETPDTTDAIQSLGTASVPQESETNIHVLTIIGQIEGHLVLPPNNKTTKYEHIIPLLLAIEESPVIEGFLIIMNTAGGDVEAGLALAELIAGMRKPSVSLVLGGGHSIGVPMAVSAKYSFIAPTAVMTVHPIRLSGMIIGSPQTYDYVDKMQERVMRFIVEHSRITRDRLEAIMQHTGSLAGDVGTALIGKDAVTEGLIDAVGGLSDAMDRLEALILERRGESSVPAKPGVKTNAKKSAETKEKKVAKPKKGVNPHKEAKKQGGEKID